MCLWSVQVDNISNTSGSMWKIVRTHCLVFVTWRSVVFKYVLENGMCILELDVYVCLLAIWCEKLFF